MTVPAYCTATDDLTQIALGMKARGQSLDTDFERMGYALVISEMANTLDTISRETCEQLNSGDDKKQCRSSKARKQLKEMDPNQRQGLIELQIKKLKKKLEQLKDCPK